MNIIQELIIIQDKLRIINAYLDSRSNIIDDEKINVLRDLKIVKGLASIASDNHDKSIKQALEYTDELFVGNYIYSYNCSVRSVFDAEKAKKTLQDCNYKLEDFTKNQEARKLIYRLNK